MTHMELEERIHKGDEKVTKANSLVMIQCVGCRNKDRNYCSRICCGESVKNALKLKEINPKMDIYILFRDMRTYGFREDYYRDASSKEVKFIRYEPEDKPQIVAGQSDDGRPVLKVTATDYILDSKLEIDADIVSLAAAIIPAAGSKEVGLLFKVSLGQDGFFQNFSIAVAIVRVNALDRNLPAGHRGDLPGARAARTEEGGDAKNYPEADGGEQEFKVAQDKIHGGE